MKPSLEYLRTRLRVDAAAGRVWWVDATKHHQRLNGREAGGPRKGHHGKSYWCVKVDSVHLKRSHVVLLFTTGHWPPDQVDHINGNSLDDRSENLRSVNSTQNAWNHKKRTKASACPMGVRLLPSGRFQARIACNGKKMPIGSFASPELASAAYQSKRKELFGEYA